MTRPMVYMLYLNISRASIVESFMSNIHATGFHTV